MEERYYIGIDVGDGKDYSVATLSENGEYHQLVMCDEMSFVSDVEHSGCVGVEAGELSFSLEVSEHSCDILRMLFGCSEDFNAQSEAFNRLRKGKRRKTTYKTTRRDCTKRNRGK